MYEIHFYKDRNGKEPVKEYIAELANRKDKNSRIKRKRICPAACFYEANTENAAPGNRDGKEEIYRISGKGKG